MDLKYTISYPRRPWSETGPMFEWCDEQFGKRGPENKRWQIAFKYATSLEGDIGKVYFTNEEDAVLFALRWL